MPSVLANPLAYRKLVRDAVLAFLAINFNDTLSAIAVPYKLSEIPRLDFSNKSENFAVSYIDKQNIENCQIQWAPDMWLGGCLYTSEAMDEGTPRGFRFAGKVMVNLDFYVRRRDGMEGFNTEDLFDAVEDAAIAVINDPNNEWPAGLIPSRQTELGRGDIIPLGDGFYSPIPMKSLFEVRVP